jgi:hypothetical protein
LSPPSQQPRGEGTNECWHVRGCTSFFHNLSPPPSTQQLRGACKLMLAGMRLYNFFSHKLSPPPYQLLDPPQYSGIPFYANSGIPIHAYGGTPTHAYGGKPYPCSYSLPFPDFPTAWAPCGREPQNFMSGRNRRPGDARIMLPGLAPCQKSLYVRNSIPSV